MLPPSSTSPIAINIASCNTLLAKWTPQPGMWLGAEVHVDRSQPLGRKTVRSHGLEEYPSLRRPPQAHGRKRSGAPQRGRGFLFSVVWLLFPLPLFPLPDPRSLILGISQPCWKAIPTREMAEEKGRAEQGGANLARAPSATHLSSSAGDVSTTAGLRKEVGERKGTLERSRSWEAKRDLPGWQRRVEREKNAHREGHSYNRSRCYL